MTDYADLKARLVSASITKIVPGDASPSLEAEAAAAIAALEAERDALRGLLAFYASESLWDYDGGRDSLSPMGRDRGQKARAFLYGDRLTAKP